MTENFNLQHDEKFMEWRNIYVRMARQSRQSLQIKWLFSKCLGYCWNSIECIIRYVLYLNLYLIYLFLFTTIPVLILPILSLKIFFMKKRELSTEYAQPAGMDWRQTLDDESEAIIFCNKTIQFLNAY